MTDQPSTKPRIDKLGIKQGMRVVLVNVRDETFEAELAERGAEVLKRRARGVDAVFYRADRASDLPKLSVLAGDIRKDGSIWLLRRKGEVKETASMQAGADAGLVDVKVVFFDDRYSAEKYVYRLRDR